MTAKPNAPYLCKKCGNYHRMGLENMETGEIEPIDVCKDCLFSTTQINIDPNFKIENCHLSLEELEKRILNDLDDDITR